MLLQRESKAFYRMPTFIRLKSQKVTYWLFGVVLLLQPFLSVAIAESEVSETGVVAASTVALNWLKQLDEKDYQLTWHDSTNLFKKKISIQQWERSAGRVHRMFGPAKGRRIISTTRKEGSQGDTVIIKYETMFGNNAKVIETIKPVLEHDGIWRISEYQLR